jgi:general secretion pathway protein C
MNKRLPLLLSLLGLILLAASLAYWILQLYQPPQRQLAPMQHAAMADPSVDAAATVFGGQVVVATATNYQLTGIVAAGRDSAAIIVADGSPPKALRLGKELAPGITLAEVHPRYVMLSDSGVMKRVDLAVDNKAAAPMGMPINVPMGNQGAQQGGQAMAQPQPQQGAVPVSAQPLPEPPMAPGAVIAQPAQQNGFTNPGGVGAHENAPPANPNSITQGAPGQTQMPTPVRPGDNGGQNPTQ